MKKKIVLLLVILIWVFGISCSRASSEINAESSKSPTLLTESAEITEITVAITPLMISDIKVLVSNSDIIIVGYVEKALPVVRIDAVKLGLVKGVSELEENVSCYQVRIGQVMKGDYDPGDMIRVDMLGGLAEGFDEIYMGLQYPVEGSTYLMFIEKSDRTEKNKYFMYRFVGTFDGFSEIVDGKIEPQKYTSIFEKGVSLDEALKEINEAVESK